MAKEIEKNLDKMSIDEEGSDTEAMPIFTPELARLRKKEQGLDVSDDAGEDDEED